MKIEILTTECSNCKVVEKILNELNLFYNVIDVTKKSKYLEKYPVFTAPAIIINEKLEFTDVPKKYELLKN